MLSLAPATVAPSTPDASGANAQGSVPWLHLEGEAAWEGAPPTMDEQGHCDPPRDLDPEVARPSRGLGEGTVTDVLLRHKPGVTTTPSRLQAAFVCDLRQPMSYKPVSRFLRPEDVGELAAPVIRSAVRDASI